MTPAKLSDLPRQLALISQARLALMEAREIGEVKDIRDKAEAMRMYLKQRDESLEAQNVAAEIKLRAERRAGEMIAGMEKRTGGDAARARSHAVTESPPKLSEFGIDKMQSSRWQDIASLPEEDFERHIEEAKADDRELTTNSVLKVAKERKLAKQRERKRANLKAQAASANGQDRAHLWEIQTGDCLKLLDAQRKSVARLVFADPPYNIGFDYGEGSKADRLPAATYLDWCQRWINAAAERLTPDGSFWLLINHEWAARLELMLGDAGLHMRAWLTWYETFGVNCANNFNRCSRRLLYAVRDPKRFIFNGTAVTRLSDRQAKYNDKRANPDGKLWDDVWGVNPAIPRLVGNAAERMPDFPTQLPVKLLEAVVGCATEDHDDLIIDPFAGSGTTGEAALRLGRRFLGFEKSPHFADLARQRLSAVKGVVDGAA